MYFLAAGLALSEFYVTCLNNPDAGRLASDTGVIRGGEGLTVTIPTQGDEATACCNDKALKTQDRVQNRVTF
jgi:hypothetical protein